ncbi:alpha/beta hydrolase family protein [Erwinia sp. V71]|uniref:alpha/beta hydrolase family protein n=1 Tax=Erwinia sp. V71 TaxID=3369424 RepID=UPI003F645294
MAIVHLKKILAVTSLLLPVLSLAAGVTPVDIPAKSSDKAIKAIIWTPCLSQSNKIQIGPITLHGKLKCPMQGSNLPLIVFSHGYGGSNLSHHDLAEYLADSGFVVAAINHPGDNYSAINHGTKTSDFINRPQDISHLIDYMLNNWTDKKSIDPHRIGFFGFSRGGYTGLVLAGGKPDFLGANTPYDHANIPFEKHYSSYILKNDSRIKAFVIADPVNIFTTHESVKNINSPIQLWISEFGGDGILPDEGKALRNILHINNEFHLVAGATHFSFLAPCSIEMSKTVPDICTDINGFNRYNFHKMMNSSVLGFYRKSL